MAQLIYTKSEVIDLFFPVVEANDDVQEFVSKYSKVLKLPEEFLDMIKNLDLAIRNYGKNAD